MMRPQLSFHVLTLYPAMFPGQLGHSLAGRALEDGVWRVNPVQIRDFAEGKHASVDDTPYGGGPGMVMRADVVDRALQSVHPLNGPLINLSPRGAPLTQERVQALAQEQEIALLCGRFEGIDQRVLDKWSVEEISLGDYVLSGGETAALTLMDAVIRLLPGVMGKLESGEEESFSNGLLEYPQYTRPAEFNGQEPPEELLSGHHARIDAWRLAQSEALTKARRPDLWADYLSRRTKDQQK